MIGRFLLQISLPFIIAVFLSYLLYPLIAKLETFHIHKTIAILLIYCLFFSLIILFIYISFPMIYEQLQDLSFYIPKITDMYKRTLFSLYISTSFLPETVHNNLDHIVTNIEHIINDRLENLISRFGNIFDYIISISMIPVLLFYILKDFDKIERKFYRLLPKPYHHKTASLFQAIHSGLGNYLRGQVLISSTIFFVTYVVFYTVKLKYALILSLFMGFMNIIPYFGPILGMVPAISVALTTSWNMVLVVIATTIIVQILEGTLLSPYIMGKTANVHPIVIIFVLLCSAKLGGVVTMMIAVPIVSVLKAIIVQFQSKTAMH